MIGLLKELKLSDLDPIEIGNENFGQKVLLLLLDSSTKANVMVDQRRWI
jgi:hypothetical protein